jgi:hypothetical protein
MDGTEVNTAAFYFLIWVRLTSYVSVGSVSSKDGMNKD